jgi:hypothetical protein
MTHAFMVQQHLLPEQQLLVDLVSAEACEMPAQRASSVRLG